MLAYERIIGKEIYDKVAWSTSSDLAISIYLINRYRRKNKYISADINFYKCIGIINTLRANKIINEKESYYLTRLINRTHKGAKHKRWEKEGIC